MIEVDGIKLWGIAEEDYRKHYKGKKLCSIWDFFNNFTTRLTPNYRKNYLDFSEPCASKRGNEIFMEEHYEDVDRAISDIGFDVENIHQFADYADSLRRMDETLPGYVKRDEISWRHEDAWHCFYTMCVPIYNKLREEGYGKAELTA